MGGACVGRRGGGARRRGREAGRGSCSILRARGACRRVGSGVWAWRSGGGLGWARGVARRENGGFGRVGRELEALARVRLGGNERRGP